MRNYCGQHQGSSRSFRSAPATNLPLSKQVSVRLECTPLFTFVHIFLFFQVQPAGDKVLNKIVFQLCCIQLLILVETNNKKSHVVILHFLTVLYIMAITITLLNGVYKPHDFIIDKLDNNNFKTMLLWLL